jgi:hypothetical protein
VYATPWSVSAVLDRAGPRRKVVDDGWCVKVRRAPRAAGVACIIATAGEADPAKVTSSIRFISS